METKRMIGNVEIWDQFPDKLVLAFRTVGVGNDCDGYDSDEGWALVEAGIDLVIEGSKTLALGVNNLMSRIGEATTDDGYTLQQDAMEQLAKLSGKLRVLEPKLRGLGR